MHQPQLTTLTSVDPEIAGLIEQEATSQHDSIRLIPSENYVSQAVLGAVVLGLTVAIVLFAWMLCGSGACD